MKIFPVIVCISTARASDMKLSNSLYLIDFLIAIAVPSFKFPE